MIREDIFPSVSQVRTNRHMEKGGNRSNPVDFGQSYVKGREESAQAMGGVFIKLGE